MRDGVRKELQVFAWLAGLFALLYYLPVDAVRFQGAVIEALRLAKWYAREHVLLCLVPAFFIAGAIAAFVSQQTVMAYFGPKANKLLAYGVASVSGTILAVCSCTVLPLFGGIYMRGAGLGPAIAFLYSGPAINVLAIVLTARVLGWQLGVARAVGAVVFSVVIGALMHLIFLKEERAKAAAAQNVFAGEESRARPLWQTGLYLAAMVGVLVFANWSVTGEYRSVLRCCPDGKRTTEMVGSVVAAKSDAEFLVIRDKAGSEHRVARAVVESVRPAHSPFYRAIHRLRFAITAAFLVALAAMQAFWFTRHERSEWLQLTWGFAKQITPLLFAGVLAAGFFLGSPEAQDAGVVPNVWIRALVGDSPASLLELLGRGGAQPPGWLALVWPLWSNFFASLAGALMYFATLTEVPIVRGLLDSGMGQGPALALLLAGPALSLPSMLVINSILGPRKTLTFLALVVGMATITGMGWGWMVGAMN